MAELAADTFPTNGANPGANWSAVGAWALPSVVSNALADPSGARIAARYNAVTWPNDQYSRIVIGPGFSSSGGLYCAGVRCDSALRTGYFAGFDNVDYGNTQTHIFKFINNVFTTLASSGTTDITAAGAEVTLEIQGFALVCKVNGVTKVSVTDGGSSIASGSAGIMLGHPTTGVGVINEWSGGNFLTAGLGSPLIGGKLLRRGALIR